MMNAARPADYCSGFSNSARDGRPGSVPILRRGRRRLRALIYAASTNCVFGHKEGVMTAPNWRSNLQDEITELRPRSRFGWKSDCVRRFLIGRYHTGRHIPIPVYPGRRIICGSASTPTAL
ncbi:hypothetical protein EVAR_5906_1 [Eumeta japonica]|uniref:Uncharacterized protein n=1 Tax=Eumeta variegata TaxID=151549 RepID=A0A4C1TCZ3_EUMVA|nr:hypothetical protein EVAR_5906_1 [Eumeta japonica]